ncbi:MAG TPA: ferritin-like domain-containing protein, partial [Polyangium sp.]|nr:ferritin-like domain-containing protein [Polyangium sp.]
ESNGNVHRAGVTTCDPVIDMPACAGTEDHQSCKSDADCKDHAHGKCVSGMGQAGSYCGCEYSCVSDGECGDGRACVCKGTGRAASTHSVCAQALCTKDADCPSKQCGLSAYHNGCSTQVTLACRTADDKCSNDLDCNGRGGQCVQNKAEPNTPWQCQYRMCAIGRPLTVEGQTFAANSTARTDWGNSVELDVDVLDPAIRSIAKNHYVEMAAMEHASVASFARFSLQLMALGAPAELLVEAHRAALDEIEHARVAYRLATLFGSTSVGPDNLPAAVAAIPMGIVEFVESLVEEGCVGETLGAGEAREAASAATSVVLTEALAKIAADEERHATLAWRTLQWAIRTHGELAVDAARRAFSRAMATYSKVPNAPGGAETLGILSGKTLGRSRRRVLASVVLPCARALGIEMTTVLEA